MSVAEDFAKYLPAQATIQALCGGRVCQAPVPPRMQKPFVVFRRSGRNEQVDLGGSGGLVETRFDVECAGNTLDEAEALSDAVHTILNGQNRSQGVTWNGRQIDGVFVEDQSDDYDWIDDTSSFLNAVASAVRVFHR